VTWLDGILLGIPWLLPPIGAIVYGRPRPNLREWEPLPRDRSPRVSIILPARNEAANLERCVRSILASEYPDFELVVVDDRSEDETGRILTRLAAEDRRVVPVPGRELPDGWYGKPWACWQGYQATSGELLLFTDADTVHGPRLLPLAVAALECERADLLTVMPLQEMKSFWERLVQPLFILFIGLRFGTPQRLNRNREPRNAIANGQFILTTRDAYQWVGGHQKVQHTVIEDMLLAREYVFAGKTMLFAVADRDMRTRMYTSLREIVDGWTKNVFVGVLENLGSKALAYPAILASLLMPLLFLLPAAALATGLATEQPVLLAFGGTAYFGASALVGYMLHAVGERDLWGLFHPLGALVQIVVLLRAAFRGTRRIEWKGRTYSADALR
jgi:chlorobactene glucosyltransferase